MSRRKSRRRFLGATVINRASPDPHRAGHFDPHKFKDRHENALCKPVQRKARGRKIELPEKEETPSNVIELEALCRSVKGD